MVGQEHAGHAFPSPLAGEAESPPGLAFGKPEDRLRDREGGAGADPSNAGADTPLSTYSPQGGRGHVEKFVLLGEFGRAHGLKGEVRLKSFTANPKDVAAYGPLATDDGRSFTLKGVRPAGGGSPDLVIARVDGIATREAAEALNRIRLYAPRERLAGAGVDDEFLLADLIGLAAKDPHGIAVGTVVAVPNYGGGDLLEIAPQGGGPTGLLPFTQAFVPRVDIAAGEIVVDPPEGFFDGPPPRPDQE